MNLRRWLVDMVGLMHLDLAAFAILLRNPKNFREYLRACRRKYFVLQGVGLPRRRIEDLFPESGDGGVVVKLIAEESHGGGMTKEELFILGLITRFLRPRNVFEIGTFNGYAVTHIALNCESLEDVSFSTLDLPENENEVSLGRHFSESDRRLIAQRRTDYFCSRHGLKDKIARLRGDSAAFDFSPYFGKMDLVIVDGAHSYDYVKNDSSVAFKMVRPGGVVLWHVYSHVGYFGWELNRALHEIAREKELVHLCDSNFVYYRHSSLRP